MARIVGRRRKRVSCRHRRVETDGRRVRTAGHFLGECDGSVVANRIRRCVLGRQPWKQELAERRDAHVVAVLRLQRDDLAGELTALLGDIASGRVVPKVYRQFKMYNDPAYRRSGGAASP